MSLMSYETLEALKNTLAGAGGANTCRIGFEATISLDDYPIIRIVPSKTATNVGFYGETTECTIYFGHPVDESSTDDGENIGLEGVHKTQLAMRDEILKRLQYPGETPLYSVNYRGTVFDEDRIAGYKLMGLLVDLAF